MSKRSRRRRYAEKIELAREQKKAQRIPDKAPDLEIEIADDSPEAQRDAEKILADAEAAGVSTIVKHYTPAAFKGLSLKPSPLAMHVNADDTHSIGIRPHPHGHAIARSLLDAVSSTVKWTETKMPDDRPLIDLLHEATFTSPPGMAVIRDAYELRMVLRKAHCFTLDKATSAMVADFSLATLPDLEASRQMAIPPFPVTWIELDNFARLKRMFELKFPLRDYSPEVPPTERIGWLIHPAPEATGYYATYVTQTDIGIWIAPMSYWWHTFDPNPEKPTPERSAETLEWLAFGTRGNVATYDAFPHPSNLHIHYTGMDPQKMVDVMKEMSGELRHIWGFLIALGAGHLGAQATYTPQPKPTTTPPIMKNGKPLLPLEHKVLHLHLAKKTPAKIVAQAITHHHNRRHEVRAHWRQLKSGKRVPIKSHERGDATLGRIEKTYHVER